ncbi:MAG: zinc-ribbon domain-containing protein, partial [Deltaproteobacteria bacterium]|nr:zinc-ribbon domain-containing protein [Deltaproteobacteria bacterium]
MKIVCDACGAKYSIADEKVAGKVFKIRCKRCSNIIVVRGDADQAAAEPAPDSNLDQKETRVFDYSGYDNPTEAAAAGGDDAVWHVVIDQEQVGPMTAAEIGQRFAAGEIDADSYIWQEGFADWERLAVVGEFAALAAGGGAAAAAAAADDGNMFGGPPVDESQTAQN